MRIPKIKIEYNLDKEVEQFISFLHHPFFPQHRNKIFNVFPELKDALRGANDKQEKEIIRKFIKNFREKNKQRIQKITAISENLLEKKSHILLKNLSELMEYEWPKKHADYRVIPSILPFSPFKNNTFFFSIISYLKTPSNQKSILFVSVHEISHLIFFELIKKIYGNSFPLNKTSAHFLKEILAPVIMNQKKINKDLKLKNYLGNPFLRDIFISFKNKKNQITNFFQEVYKAGIKKGLNFNSIFKIMVEIIKSIESEIEYKNNIWNQYGNAIFKNEKNLKIYQKPIKIKKAPKIKDFSTLFKN